ncbi:hypothetical protein [Aldersonia kunmingensis]|uniref:hypothetical protein n=1 Tax=Aldersonia kunmingensis TaxID=408066 RepID=UPI000829C3DC|nr:hypothetical protein [Aldersonia kunmingensis]
MTGPTAGRGAVNPARRQKLEVLIGFLGMLTLLVFVAAVFGIIRGEPSPLASLLLFGVAAGLGLAIRARLRA